MQTVVTEAEERRYAELQLIALDYARDGQTEPLAAMLASGLPPNLADAKGQTLLMLASYHGHLETTRLLLERGAEVDRRNDRGQTPLGGVAFKGELAIVSLLLDYKAEIDADQGGGMTPLMLAAMFGRTRVVDLLAARGASTELRNRLGLSAGWMARVSGWIARIFRRSAPSSSTLPDQARP